MKFFSKAKDGGPESPVDGYFLIEIKSLFSIVLLHFNPGTREAFHSHAFNAVTLWLRGKVTEEARPEDKRGVLAPYVETANWQSGQVKYTPRELMHRIVTPKSGAWALSFRGPWSNTWQEYKPATGETITLTHGRKIVTE